MFDTPNRLHPASIVINFGAYFLAVGRSLIAPVIAILVSKGHSTAQFVSLVIGGSIAVIGGISLIAPVLHYLSTTFYIHEDALEISSGFIWRKKRTIPLARIQNVNVERTLWHRILGAAAVKVETAAGHKGEGDLTALSVENANRLQAVLLQRSDVASTPEPQTKPAPLYELSTKQVLLAGALGNRAMYIIASVFAVLQSEGSQKFYPWLIRYSHRLGPVATVVTASLAFLGLVVIGWLVSIVISATRFYGFKIERHERGLLLSHGLITQFRSIIPVGRIQDVRIVQPIMYQLLGYSEIYADTAGSFDKKDVASANKICPILPEDGVDKIGHLLMEEFEFGGLSWMQVSRKTIGRHAIRSFITWTILLAVPLGYWLRWHALWFAPPLAISSGIMGLLYYRYVGYAFTDDILVARRGIFRKEAVIIPFDRIQHYTINSSFFQRFLGLATITAISASTSSHPIHIADVEIESADRLRRTIGASIYSHIGSRRGGL